jgi:hypothetical protein
VVAVGQLLGGTVWLSTESANGVLPDVLDREGVPWQVVAISADLPSVVGAPAIAVLRPLKPAIKDSLAGADRGHLGRTFWGGVLALRIVAPERSNGARREPLGTTFCVAVRDSPRGPGRYPWTLVEESLSETRRVDLVGKDWREAPQ